MISYRQGYKYQLCAECNVQTAVRPDREISNRFIRLLPSGLLTIRADYAWDGPSGPTVDTPDGMRASLVHDALYQLMREGLLDHHQWKEAADAEFHRILVESGMAPGRARLWWAGVHRFGEPSCDPKNDRPVLTAP